MSFNAPDQLSQVTFRSAHNDDRQRIQKLIFGILGEFDLKPDPDGTDLDLEDIESNYIKRGGLFDVIEDENRNLIGTFGLYPLDATTCELRKMYLARKWRGHGLGRYVLSKGLDSAKELGFTKIVLETSSKLVAAIQLYQSFGFQPAQMEHVTPRADQCYAMDL